MWVKSEYASELAVLSAWVAMLLPWNVAWKVVDHAEVPLDSTIFFFRFAVFELQLRSAATITFNASGVGGGVQQVDAGGLLAQQYPGTELVADFFVTTPPTAALFYEAPELARANLAWSVAAACFLAAFALSLALYLREEAVRERLPVSEVRLMGALLLAGTLGTAAATALYALAQDVTGAPIPIGVVVVGALAVVLLRTERV